MTQWAVTAAVMGFFLLAFAGWLGGCTIFRCAVRGLIGAVVIFVAVRLLLKLFVRIVAETMAKGQMSGQDQERERRGP